MWDLFKQICELHKVLMQQLLIGQPLQRIAQTNILLYVLCI